MRSPGANVEEVDLEEHSSIWSEARMISMTGHQLVNHLVEMGAKRFEVGDIS